MRNSKKLILLSICIAGFLLVGCRKQDVSVKSENTSAVESKEGETENMKIQIEANGNKITFELNGSQAAKDLYEQLPLTTENEDFSNNEKTFYPPKKLDVTGAPHTDGSVGTLAYYEPWGDVVIFYGDYHPNDALYELGKVSSGSAYMETISGEMTISAIDEEQEAK